MRKLEDISDWKQMINEVVCGDCLEGMKLLPDKCVDLVLTDPPYGKMWTRGKNSIGSLKDKCEADKTLWDKTIPTQEVFTEIMRISKNQIIFGGNYFSALLPPSNCWLVWDKLGELKLGEQIPFAHCELVWTSFNKTVKKYTLRQQGFINDSNDVRVHPTQKPTEIIRAIIEDFSKDSDTIFDPFMGSWTTARACKDLGLNFIGFELSEKYCQIGEERLRQQNLF